MICRSAPSTIRSSASAKSDSVDLVVAAPRREQRRLVDEVREVGADHARRRRGDPAEVDVGASGTAARVHLEDRLAAGPVGRLHGDAAVEAARAAAAPGRGRPGGWSRAITITPVDGVEAVHLGEDLVQRLLALVVAAAEAGDARRARAADRVELVDEDDRRRRRLRLREQVAHAGRRRRRRSPRRTPTPTWRRTARWPRRRRPARAASCPCRAGPMSSTPCGMRAAEPAVLLRVAQEVDDLDQLLPSPRRCRRRPRRSPCRRAARSGAPRAAERAEHVLDVRRRGASAERAAPTKRIVGPKPRSRLSHQGAPVSSGCALTTTPFCSSRSESASVSANAGISVLNFVVGFAPS